MSSHLIQTIDIEGTRYCPKNHDGRMTDAVKTSYVYGVENSADVSGITKLLIVMPAGEVEAVGEVSFGVTCATQLFPVNFYSVDTSTVEDYFIDIYLSMNGDNAESGFASIYNETVGDESESIGNLIDLSNVPCGNIITLTVYAARPYGYLNPETSDGELTLTVEILGAS